MTRCGPIACSRAAPTSSTTSRPSSRSATRRRVGRVIRLWHLDISHYNEKARWALDYKRVPHVRRAVPPGVHFALALGMTRRMTLPIVTFDGHAVGDSTAIIAELERRFPEPPLYPADPEERARALALEEL